MWKKIRELFKQYKEEKGQGVVEYALILGFVAILAVALFQTDGLKSKVQNNMTAVGNELDAMSNAITSQTSAIHSASGSSTD